MKKISDEIQCRGQINHVAYNEIRGRLTRVLYRISNYTWKQVNDRVRNDIDEQVSQVFGEVWNAQ